MKLNDIRAQYLEYMRTQDHVIVPSGRIIPDNDPTTLFTGSGMQPMIPYLLGDDHPEGSRIADSQKCFRAEDIEEVGDNRHTTFFEMLGNWSFGDYGKKEQITWMFDFLVRKVGIDPKNLYITCYIGDEKNDLSQDTEAADLWKGLFASVDVDADAVEIGTEAQGYARGIAEGERIFYYDGAKNWWSRAGKPDHMPVGEPGGPDSEMFYDFGTPHDESYGAHCHPNCDCGRFMEIGNNVFMEYLKKSDGTFGPLPRKNIDFGGGLERIAAAAQGTPDIYKVDAFSGVIVRLEKLSGKSYDDADHTFAFRVIVDHVRGSIFMLSDGILPSNKEQGYILRRLLRRAMFYGTQLGLDEDVLVQLTPEIIAAYEDAYPILVETRDMIIREMKTEEEKFHKTLVRGTRELHKMIERDGELTGEDAFVLFTTYGFPLEMTLEVVEKRGIVVDRDAYESEFARHRDLSRTASAGKFKGGLADHSAQTTALHTCTHLMLAGLRKELGDHVHQAGSNITEQRTRFDFTHGEKVERDVLDRVEAYVNDAIADGMVVEMLQMDKQVAKDEGVEGSFWEKYPDTVNVYTMTGKDDVVYSQELCGGPHVSDATEIVGTFRITSEKSSSAGVRRIKASLE